MPSPKYFKMLQAPKVTSDEAAAEAVELYWMSLLRDVSFREFSSSTDVSDAAAELTGLTDFTGPTSGGSVTPDTIFRGCEAGNLAGPFLSQFLLRTIPYGSLTISQIQQTVPPNFDHLTAYNAWLAAQNGENIAPVPDDPMQKFYIRNMRDLAEYVHRDALYEAYLNACLILLFDGVLAAPVDSGNPYVGRHAGKEAAFGTFGGPHILTLVCEAATRALKAVWWQKWYVHRRVRPEAYAGLVHQTLNGLALLPAGNQAVNSTAVLRTNTKFGTALLPMAFPEGSPTHPSYGAGHATVAGACVTILKAWFLDSHPFPQVFVPNAAGTGLDAVASPPTLTVGGELNKIAANIAIGRNMAGVHWRSDYTQSVRLGEKVALHLLHDQSRDYAEREWSWTLTSFDGDRLQIDEHGVFYADGPKAGQPYLVLG